ncbi:MAG: FAD-dependent oxidoreductase [Acidobacteria bacterium]|nr:FAD-dependent oxidoreductase [Acidobacteriota bacterium]
MAGDRFAPATARRLLAWILAEEKRGQVFGIHRELFFQPGAAASLRLERCGRQLETPLGVAAGPHTQLAQNIVTAWLCGARFIELKTVQTLDRLEVRKPCIAVDDAGYNCEWSQELTLDESFQQYLAAWVLLHVLRRRSRRGALPVDPGFLFNFSVGYDLAGILQPNMQCFLDRMSCCYDEKEMLLRDLEPLFPGIHALDIPSCISDNVTLSTMHGCPPGEIEKIGLYLLAERKLHTTVKLNPTLLGPERLRGLLNGTLGWKVKVPDQAFEHDLKYDAALDIIRSLKGCAAKNGLRFSVKLTNTLECLNDGALPAREKTVYMSGRPLRPLAVALARRLQDDLQGGLDITYSAGGDCFSAAELLACGLRPLTVCSDLLRPGGYARLGQYLEEIRGAMKSCRATTLDELVLKRARMKDPALAVRENLKNYEAALERGEDCRAPLLPGAGFKGRRSLSWFDCALAPCRDACAIGQDVSRYMHWVGRGDDDRAKAVVWETNPLPATCGMVCDQKCQGRCTRGLFDRPLAIRAVKRFAVENGSIPAADPASLGDATRVSVVGAGPAGLAAARELARGGFWVEVFEAHDQAGGLAATVIPGFRLSAAALEDDVARLKEKGVVFRYNQVVDGKRLAALLDEFQLVFLAGGAGRGRRLLIPEEDAAGVHDALEFLAAAKRGAAPDIGSQVVVIGGGNSAMDAARTARRLCGVHGRVTVIYRRTLAEMPAAAEEIRAALAEGVRIMELTAPLRIEVAEGREWALLCSRMELRKADSSGRPHPVPVFGSEFELTCDAVIVAIGQDRNAELLAGTEWQAVGDEGGTSHPRLFVIGDARGGPSTLVRAIADGSRAVDRILEESGRTLRDPEPGPLSDRTWLEHALQRSRRQEPEPPAPAHGLVFGADGLADFAPGLNPKAARREAQRCFHCDDLCLLCVGACPNRALVAFETRPGRWPLLHGARHSDGVVLASTGVLELRQKYQLVHVVDFCNACGNCSSFCPTAGAPYKDKPHVFLSRRDFEQAADGFYLKPLGPTGARVLQARAGGELQHLRLYPDRLDFENDNCLLRLKRDDFSYLAADWRREADPAFDGRLLAQMAVLLEFLPPFLHGDDPDV